jgi:hypothetical protein
MDGFSILKVANWQPQDITALPEYHAGNALGWLYRGDKQAATSYPLAGRLYLSKSNWLLLSVPNALVRGVYDALSAPGVELPLAGTMNVPNVKEDLLNAHISVMTAEEVEQVGADKINERGHTFSYTLGPMTEITPKNTAGVSKVWAIQITSPALSALRRSYGLPSMPKGDQPFHITVAVRRTGVLLNNQISKSDETSAKETNEPTFRNPTSRGALKAASADETTYDCGCSGHCMCPDTCVCKKTGCGGQKTSSALEKQHSNTLSRAGQKDLLPGGKADNVPDREIPSKTLAEGQKHEREHTSNDQVAKEIAKDHLHEDPAYYKKVKMIEKAAQPEIIRRVTKSANSVYIDQALNQWNSRQPLRYNQSKPVFQNIREQMMEMKRRGDFILQAKRNNEMYMSALSPQYRYQRMMNAFHGKTPQQSPVDTLIENYGDQALAAMGPRQ